MNTKTKLMLGLSALTAGTLAAGATGTFAWFTTNKTATATYSNIVAAATQGNIKASISGVTDKNATAEKGTNVTATGSASKISDVSSNDGLNFVQPDWIGESGNTKTANSLLDVSKTTGYFTQYNVSITNESNDNNTSITGDGLVNVVLSGLKITSSDYSDMTKWVRVAIIGESFSAIGETTASSALGVYTDIVTTNTNDKYVKSLKDDHTLELETSVVKSANDLVTSPITIATNLKVSATKTIGVSVWLEGTANGDTSQDGCKGKSVSVALEFTAKAVNA